MIVPEKRYVNTGGYLFVELHNAALDLAAEKIDETIQSESDPWIRLQTACATQGAIFSGENPFGVKVSGLNGHINEVLEPQPIAELRQLMRSAGVDVKQLGVVRRDEGQVRAIADKAKLQVVDDLHGLIEVQHRGLHSRQHRLSHRWHRNVGARHIVQR